MVLAILTVEAVWGHFPVAAVAQTKVVQEVDAFIHSHVLHREPLHMCRCIQSNGIALPIAKNKLV